MAGSMARLARFVPAADGPSAPEFECWHPGDESEGDTTAKFGIRVGIRLLPWSGWCCGRSIQSPSPTSTAKLWTHRVALLEATRQQGKALDVATPILTTAGWSTMGDLQVGDGCSTPTGIPRVIGTFDVMQGHRCYEVTTIDGALSLPTLITLWTVQDTRRQRYVNGRRSNEFCGGKP